MKILLCNDDGITSPFLEATARALAKLGDLKIVVPATEQSWIGRAYSRHNILEHKKVEFLGFDTYTINGTPSDCVNIALEHFYKDEKPDLVFSGINIGYNITMPLLLSSGTFAAAVESAGAFIPSFSVSLQLKHEFYQLCRLEHRVNAELEDCISTVASSAADFVLEAMKNFKPEAGEVYNLNFPSEYKAGDEIFECAVAKVPTRALYNCLEDDKYSFKYVPMEELETQELTDFQCLSTSRAGYSKINVFNFGK
ncbi:MAG: 5'/3'-nucleotidase SurE [Opitutales bacterium]